MERYKQAFQRAGGTPLIDYYRALVDGMALGTQDERWVSWPAWDASEGGIALSGLFGLEAAKAAQC